jgi:hypothetical protein
VLLAVPLNAQEVSVGSVTAAPGEVAAVPVFLQNNSIKISALSVPLTFSSNDLTVDSVSFAGTLIQPDMTPLVNIDNGTNFVQFTYSPISGLPIIEDTEGLLATVYFTITASAPEQTVAIDSVNNLDWAGPPQVWTRVEFADSAAILYLPDFSPGNLQVQSPTDVDDDLFGLPMTLALKQNYPNPFNPATTIEFTLPERAHVSLRVYNILGQELATLVDETKSAGDYSVVWNASRQASGIYFYRLTYQDKVLTKKMALLK